MSDKNSILIAQPVTLSLKGNSCVISNGILSMYWKDDGTLGLISRNGVELVRNLPGCSDTDGKGAFYVDYHAEGAFRGCRSPKLRVIENNDQMAHVAYVDTTGYLAIEFHIILMQGESGYYSYVIGANNTDSPFELSEFRIVYRCGSRIFDHAYNCERHGLQPTHKYMEQYEKLQDETYCLPDGEKYSNGEVYSKYDYAGHYSRNPVWGQYGHGYGFFVIPASTEYYPGGPLKQELLVHYDGIVLNYFTGSHFGNGNLHVPIGWKKFYGPFYQYFNESGDPQELFQDALGQAELEKEKWPYQWVHDELYPLNRSSVSGRLIFGDGMPCEGATVILGQKDLPIELQSAGYIYYTETDVDGRFTLPQVRFDTYSLFAYQTGGSNTNQLQADDIVIDKANQDLGVIIWKLPNESVIWQLGKATRTCEGYRYGGELRNYKWMTMVPKTLHFYIRQSKEEEDWYYAQTNMGSWYIHFQMDSVPEDKCYLIIAIAGASRAGTDNRDLPCLSVYLNDRLLEETVFVNDGAVYRSATQNGRYRRMKIAVDPSVLCVGENIIELRTQGGSFMYDTILLTEESISVNSST
jgi:Rhamnogalacturonate lyase family.